MRAWAPGDALPGEERPFFLPVGTSHLAVVRHTAAGGARAVVVLAGPMSLERSHGYLTWVRWARTLAANGFEVLRFDFRGVGESTGDFREQTFDAWREDLEAVVAHARSFAAGRKLVVLGLRLGALLGRAVFDAGACDALVAWDPPVGGTPMLLDMLRRKLAADYMELAGERKTRDEYIRDLELGHAVEVEGYPWSKGLWRSASACLFGEPRRAGGEWLVVYLDGRPAERLPERERYASVRIPKPSFWLQSGTLVPRLDELFDVTLNRLDAWAGAERQALASSDAPRATGARELHVIDLEAGRCVGAHHVPARRASDVGLLWLNFGYVPRDGHGGLATYASDVMAARGVPAFRYDLPGLGDAPGALPETTQTFYPQVTGGRYTEVTRQLVRWLCETQHLDGVVLAGLCGGAVNAIYVGDREPQLVRGVALLEPELYVTEPAEKGDAAIALAPAWVRTLRAKLFSYWGWMRLLTHENRYARFVPLPRKAILEFVLERSELPSVTNLPLTAAWQRWVRAHRPALVVTAEGKLRELFLDRINDNVLSGVSKRHYQHVRLGRTNHIFTSGGAIEAVTGLLERAWPMLAGEVEGPVTARRAS